MPQREWKNGLESEPVTTYVDAEVKSAWQEHAENLDVSLSRFVEMMVNAGRTVYADSAPEDREDDLASAKRTISRLQDRLDAATERSEPGDAFAIYRCLQQEGYRSVEEVASDVDADESCVYEALQMLLDEDLVAYDVMRNGYQRR